jgi:hypothetical protein
MLGRVHEPAFGDIEIQKTAWSLCTIAFALGQAGGAYGLAYIFAHTGSGYALLFAFGAAALPFAFTIEIATAILGFRQSDMSAYTAQEEVNAACE